MALHNDALKLPLSDSDLERLVAFSNIRSMSTGIIVALSDSRDEITYTPHTLFPSPVPRDLFEKAVYVQTGFNELMWKVTKDEDFLSASLKRQV